MKLQSVHTTIEGQDYTNNIVGLSRGMVSLRLCDNWRPLSGAICIHAVHCPHIWYGLGRHVRGKD